MKIEYDFQMDDIKNDERFNYDDLLALKFILQRVDDNNAIV